MEKAVMMGSFYGLSRGESKEKPAGTPAGQGSNGDPERIHPVGRGRKDRRTGWDRPGNILKKYRIRVDKPGELNLGHSVFERKKDFPGKWEKGFLALDF